MSNNSTFKLFPNWKKADQKTLSLYRNVGIFAFILGAVIISLYVPTINLGMKLLGAIVLGYGVNLFLNANHYLKK